VKFAPQVPSNCTPLPINKNWGNFATVYQTLNVGAGIDFIAAKRAMVGCLLGDCLGLPYENLTKRRASRLLPFPLRQRLLFRRGLPSDDSVQSFLLIQALFESQGDKVAFIESFARKIRVWFLPELDSERLKRA
jgi:hypothetical protein